MNESEARLAFARVKKAIGFPFEVELRFRVLHASFGKARKQGRYRRITLARQFLDRERIIRERTDREDLVREDSEYDENEFYSTMLHEFCHLWRPRIFLRENSREFKERFDVSIRVIRAPLIARPPAVQKACTSGDDGQLSPSRNPKPPATRRVDGHRRQKCKLETGTK